MNPENKEPNSVYDFMAVKLSGVALTILKSLDIEEEKAIKASMKLPQAFMQAVGMQAVNHYMGIRLMIGTKDEMLGFAILPNAVYPGSPIPNTIVSLGKEFDQKWNAIVIGATWVPYRGGYHEITLATRLTSKSELLDLSDILKRVFNVEVQPLESPKPEGTSSLGEKPLKSESTSTS